MRRHLTRLIMPVLLLGSAPLLSASANSDWERSQYCEHLAKRLRLYEDGLEWSKGIEDEAVRVASRAQIYRTWSENLTGKAREEKRKLALEELAKVKTPAGRVALARMKLDFIAEAGYEPSELASVRAYDPTNPAFEEERAASIWNQMYIVKEEMRDSAFGNDSLYANNEWITTLIDCYLMMLRSSYSAIRMMPDLSQADRDERDAVLSEMRNYFNEMRFEQGTSGYFPVPFFDCFFMLGDTQLALGNLDLAIQQYLAVKELLKGYPAANPTVSFHSLRSIIRAVEILMNDFGNDAKRIKAGRDLIAEAFERFPRERRTTQGRQLKLLDVQASLKLGEGVDTALTELLEMARDTSSRFFQGRAATALGDVAQLPALTIAQRIECVKAIMAVNSLQTNQISIMVLHSVLASIDSENTYEAYAPFCYASIGRLYESQGRFYEAASVFLEGSQRMVYLRNNNDKWEGSSKKLPAHFFDAKGKPFFEPLSFGDVVMTVASEGDAYDISKQLAARAALNAGYLTSKKYGAANIGAFESLKREVDEWNANFLGLSALYRKLQSEGIKKYPTDRLMSGYILMNSHPAHGNAQNGVYLAGSVFSNYFTGQKAKESDANWSGFDAKLVEQVLVGQGEFNLTGVDTTATDIKFTSHMARVDSDFSELPAWVKEMIRKDIQDQAEFILKTASSKSDYAWSLANYCFRRAAYFAVNDDMRRLGEQGLKLDTPSTFGEMILAWAQFVNQNDILQTPKAKRVPDKKMIAIAKSFNQMSYLMRQEVSTREDQNTRLRAGMDSEIALLGGVLLKAFRPHLEAAIGLPNNPEFADLDDIKRDAVDATVMLKSFIVGEFDHYVDARRPSQALESMMVYRDSFFADATGADKEKEGRNVYSMVSRLFNIMVNEQARAAQIRLLAATRLESHIFSIYKGGFTNGALRAAAEANPNATMADLHGAALTALRTDLLTGNFDGTDAKTGLFFTKDKDGNPMPYTTYVKNHAQYRATFVNGFDALVAKYRGLQAEKLGQLAGEWAADSKNAEAKDALSKAKTLCDEGKPYEAYATIKAGVVGKSVTVRGLETQAGFVFNYYGDGVGLSFQDEVTQLMSTLHDTYRREAGEMLLEYLAVSDALDVYRKYSSSAENDASKPNPELATTLAMYSHTVAESLGKDGAAWWGRAYAQWKAIFTLLEGQGKISDPAFINLDLEKKMLVKDELLADEIEIRHNLGVAAMNTWALTGFTNEAAYADARDNLRRVYNICQWRVGVNKDMADKVWNVNLDSTKTFSRVDSLIFKIARDYKAFGDYHVANKIEAKWGGQTYWKQDVTAVTIKDAEAKDASEKHWRLPTTELEWLTDSHFMYFALARSFGEKGGSFNRYYREFMLDWVKLNAARLPLGGFNLGDTKEVGVEAVEKCARLLTSYAYTRLADKKWAQAEETKAFLASLDAELDVIVKKLPAENRTRKEWDAR